MKLYETNEWKGPGKQNYYRNVYKREKDDVVKYKTHRYKTFDGRENSWNNEEREIERWDVSDSNLPGWLRKLL